MIKAINRIQNKSFCLHNIGMCTVFILYVFIYTHTVYFEIIYMYTFILFYFILYINIFNI